MMNGISIPGNLERTFDTYFYSGNITPDAQLYFAIDTYDVGGYASGTYFLTEMAIEEAQ